MTLYTMNCQILAKKYFSKIIRRIGWGKNLNWSFGPLMMVFLEVGMFQHVLYLKSIQE
jgi:hypothetical protein